jgi:hypothetical protein
VDLSVSPFAQRVGWIPVQFCWEIKYSIRPIILFANVDISRHILVIDTSVLAKSNICREK